MAAPVLKVKIQLTEGDLRKFWEQAINRQTSQRRVALQLLCWLVTVPLIPVIPYLFSNSVLDMPREAVMAWGILLIFGFYVLYASAQSRQRLCDTWLKSIDARSHLQPMVIDLCVDGLRSTTQLMQCCYAWSLVTDIVRRDETIYVWIGASRSYIIPERCFESENTVENFVQFAEQQRAQFVGGILHCPKCGYDLRGDAFAGCPECGWGRAVAE